LTTSTPSSRRVDAGAEGAAALAERLGHTFGDLSLLQHALAHRSWCGEQEGGAPSNERLEFLGDAVLGLVVAGHTYERFPDFAEGKLAKVRSAVVNARVLAQVARSEQARVACDHDAVRVDDEVVVQDLDGMDLQTFQG